MLDIVGTGDEEPHRQLRSSGESVQLFRRRPQLAIGVVLGRSRLTTARPTHDPQVRNVAGSGTAASTSKLRSISDGRNGVWLQAVVRLPHNIALPPGYTSDV